MALTDEDEKQKFAQLTLSMPNFESKRKRTLLAMTMRMFLYGIEYTMILPSVWLYLKQFESSKFFLGLVVASASFSAVVCLPILGRVYDMTKRLREILFAINVCSIAGNVIYSLHLSEWCPFFGRVISGLGGGFIAAAVAEIGHTYPTKDRTGVIALIGIAQVFGFTVGPALNFVVDKMDFTILGNWKIDSGSGAGFCLAILSSVLLVLCCMCVDNLAYQISGYETSAPYAEDIAAKGYVLPTEDDSTRKCEDKSKEVIGIENHAFSIWNEQPEICAKNLNEHVHHGGEMYSNEIGKKSFGSTMDAFKELKSIEVITLLSVELTLWLSQTILTLFLSPLAIDEYGWSQIELSVLFLVGSIEVILVLVCVILLSRKFQIKDVNLVLVSLVMSFMAVVFMVLETVPENRDYRLPALVATNIAQFVAFALNITAVKAQLNKITRPESQGTIQAVDEALSNTALVLGPILGSVTYDNRRIYGVTMAGVILLETICLILCRKKILRRQAENETEQIA